MSYKTKPAINLYKYENNTFKLQAIIDDFQEVSFEHNLYEAGTFTISINYNIPNALKFERGLFVQFGNSYNFGEIISISDAIGEDGEGSQIRTITGYDARYLLKRRVIKNMNSNGLWTMTGKGEIVLRNLINDQCGTNAEAKRQLPITNTIPTPENAIGNTYSVSESFSNLYEVCKTIATQSEIGWRIEFNGTSLNLVCYSGEDRSQTVRFDTDYESLAEGEFTDSSDAFSNAIYVGGKGQNDDRDIYEGEDAIGGNSPSGLDRFECWDNQSSMTTESEYEAEALSMLSQYGQTITLSGKGLAKCPYVFQEQYNVGDIITVAFSGKSAVVQILSVTEHWTWNEYDMEFSFGKPLPGLDSQLQLILNQIQKASNKTNSKDSVRWYTIPTDTSMPASDVTYTTIGFIGDVGNDGKTFTLYRDASGTGSKTYHVYFKQLAGSGKLTLTTGVSGASNLVMNSGTYVAIIYVDENGNVTTQGATPTDVIASGNTQPATSSGVAQAISSAVGSPDVSNAVGILPVLHGGTGQNTQGATNKAIIADLSEGSSDVTDGTMFLSSYASNNGFSDTNDGGPNKPYKRKFLTVWNYIKGKISSVLGLTVSQYGGNSETATDADKVDGKHASDLVPKRTNGYLYNPAIANYWGSSGGKYFRIKLPKGSATWAMIHLEVSLRTYGGSSNNTSGKLLIHAHWASNQEWNAFYYSKYGDLPASIAVYGSDKTYIYIYSNTTYTTCSLDRVLLGDNITNYDVSAMEIDNVSALPTTYQTATLTSSIPDVGNGQAISFAYSKAGLTTTPSWIAAWNGYELRAFDPKKMFLDYAYPVGSVYMSTTHTSPQNFLGGTWEEFTDGRFLRASGGNAGTVGQVQAEGLPNISGSVDNASGTYGVMGFDASSSSFSGALEGSIFSGYSRTGQSSGNTGAKHLQFNASKGNATIPDGQSSGSIYGNSEHVTPKNMAVYMWRRTS